MGDLDVEEAECHRIASACHAVVASLGYRLAPEHKFPIPINDCYAGFQWAIEHASELNIDSSKAATTGMSAGALAAIVVACMDTDSAEPRSKFVAAVQPLTVVRGFEPDHLRSQLRSVDVIGGADGDKSLRFLAAQHVPKGQERNPYIVPLIIVALNGSLLTTLL
ncbi:hypothetical protein BZG36_04902 [Bifiguratus adelaidae]|uniref:Alpha/beta hydrolase fold-3 domain-containing protein n=1 Tax=Bifiguratus adelaidae TaxID=1938954 RepID=A0A261XY23_9FUNG|nr:hypothetical protein BZG36_04902 [Bifiguratus adelaidae]